MKVTTRKAANGTYAYIVSDENGILDVTQTQATTALGARVQGLRFAAKVAAIPAPGRDSYYGDHH